MSYSIVTGYHHQRGHGYWAAWFYRLWLNTLKAAPERIFVIGSNRCLPPLESQYFTTEIILSGDLGHVDQLISGENKHWGPQCAAVWLAGAALCYANGTDFLYREQDVLWFGPMIEQLYSDIGDKSVLFGRNQMHGAATSVLLVKHEFIPYFIRDYIDAGPENRIERLPETKMLRLAGQYPEHYGQHSIPCDKDRPIPMDHEVFYCQKMTPNEMRELEAKGLISCDGMPEVEIFSNHK